MKTALQRSQEKQEKLQKLHYEKLKALRAETLHAKVDEAVNGASSLDATDFALMLETMQNRETEPEKKELLANTVAAFKSAIDTVKSYGKAISGAVKPEIKVKDEKAEPTITTDTKQDEKLNPEKVASKQPEAKAKK